MLNIKLDICGINLADFQFLLNSEIVLVVPYRVMFLNKTLIFKSFSYLKNPQTCYSNLVTDFDLPEISANIYIITKKRFTYP